ncbi:MAG: ComEA family DNA-binding protein, partial [Solirubrobacterales bacterium]
PASPPPQSAPPPAAPVSLNSATFEQLRSLGMSVTQTGRVLAYRERNQSFRSVDELDAIPGFPNGFLDGIRDRLTT